MRIAIISDIHSNIEALTQVLRVTEEQKVDRIVSLGDIVGYGPDPLEATDLVRGRCAWSLMGNHDFGVLYEPTNFNPGAESAAFWTREQFAKEPDEKLLAERYDFLGRLPARVGSLGERDDLVREAVRQQPQTLPERRERCARRMRVLARDD